MDAPEYRETSYTSLLKFAKDVNSFGRLLRKKSINGIQYFRCVVLSTVCCAIHYRDLNSVGRKVYILMLQNVPLTNPFPWRNRLAR
jgi:hypothetical protein